MVENLKYMMECGYYNFKINYALLKRSNNDVVIAINKLCNNMVTESMFGEMWTSSYLGSKSWDLITLTIIWH